MANKQYSADDILGIMDSPDDVIDGMMEEFEDEYGHEFCFE